MELKEVIESFVVSRKADGRAVRTIKDYWRVLGEFSGWCTNQGVTLEGFTRDAIRAHVASLRARGWAEGTVAIHVRNLRSFLRWLSDEGYTAQNLAAAVAAPRRVRRVELPITEDEITKLLATCELENFFDLRNKAIILTLYDTGLRCGELVQLKVGDWQRDRDGGGSYLMVYAPKTNTVRYAMLGRVSTKAMRAYVKRRGAASNNAPLFSTPSGKPMAVRGIESVLMRQAWLAGLDRSRTHPHIFRKAFATSFLDNGGDSERLRVLCGWSSNEMAQVYVNSALGRLREVHRRAGPVDRMMERK
jgi:site-specific recombinase XerD